jgi:hypothetical protein
MLVNNSEAVKAETKGIGEKMYYGFRVWIFSISILYDFQSLLMFICCI